MRAVVQALEAGTPVLGGCARLRRIHASPLLSVDLWRCVEDGEALRAERCHAAPVLTVLLSGASVLQEGDRAVVVEAGTALLNGAGFVYRSAHPFGCRDTGCHVRPSTLLLQEMRIPRAACTATAMAPRLHLRFRQAVEQAALGESDGLGLEEACLSLLATAPDAPAADAKRPPSRRHAELVEAAKTLLLRRFAEPMSLDDIARALGTSPFHLARLFRRLTGESLHGYRTRVRLQSALERLDAARGALSDLALEVGFASQSHFTDAFRRAFGVPPGAVSRRRSRNR